MALNLDPNGHHRCLWKSSNSDDSVEESAHEVCVGYRQCIFGIPCKGEHGLMGQKKVIWTLHVSKLQNCGKIQLHSRAFKHTLRSVPMEPYFPVVAASEFLKKFNLFQTLLQVIRLNFNSTLRHTCYNFIGTFSQFPSSEFLHTLAPAAIFNSICMNL